MPALPGSEHLLLPTQYSQENKRELLHNICWNDILILQIYSTSSQEINKYFRTGVSDAI